MSTENTAGSYVPPAGTSRPTRSDLNKSSTTGPKGTKVTLTVSKSQVRGGK